MRRNFLKVTLAAITALSIGAIPASAGSLADRIAAGQTIRIGFANEVPWAYPGEDSKPLGFVSATVIGVLHTMGYDKIEPVVTDWGGLIPGLKAGRFDIITGGMYILKSRCENIDFSEPIGVFGDAFIVAKGNPKNLNTYQDIKNANAVFVTGAGYNTVEVAKKEGIADSNIMQVPGPTEILAAIRAGRADAGGMTYFTALNLAKETNGEIDVTNPSLLPEWTLNWVGIGFRPEDSDFLAAFNAAEAEYLGSEAMLKAVAEYGYTKAQLPGDVTTAWACDNR